MPWKILADAVMVLHLLLMAFFAVSALLLALGVFKKRRNWQFFYCGVVVLAMGLSAVSWAGVQVLLLDRPGIYAEEALRPQRKLDENKVATRDHNI